MKLTDKELLFLKDLTKKRNNKEKIFGARTYGGVQGSGKAHFIGLVGEYAVAKSLGLSLDTTIFEYHGDDGVDTTDGKWGVKTTSYLTNPYLRVEVHHFKEDLTGYVLCAYNPNVDLREVKIIGWATPEEVKKGEKIRLRKGGPLNYVLKEGFRNWPSLQVQESSL